MNIILLVLFGLRHSATALSMKGCVFIATTSDGYIADVNGEVGFLDAFQTPNAEDTGFDAFMRSVDVMVMGRATFDTVPSFGLDAWSYGKTPVVVWSRNPQAVEGQIPDKLRDSVRSSGNTPIELMKQFEKDGHKRAYIDGGRTIQEFMKAGKVDEIVISQVPITLGEGIALFTKSCATSLVHEDTRTFQNGIVQSKYTLY